MAGAPACGVGNFVPGKDAGAAALISDVPDPGVPESAGLGTPAGNGAGVLITLVFDLISSGVDFNVADGSKVAGFGAAGTGAIPDIAGAGEVANGNVALGKTTVGGIDFAGVENGAAGGGGVATGIFTAGGAKTGAGALGAADTGAGTDGNPGMAAFGAKGGMGAAAGIAGDL